MKFTHAFTTFLTAALTVAVATSARAQAAQFLAPQVYTSNGAVDGPTMYWSANGDFDGDGVRDLAAADGRSLNNIFGFSIASGRADGGFETPVSYSVGAFVRSLYAADFNRDGRSDLLLVALSGTASVLPGNVDRTFGSPIQIPLPLSANDATIADFNGDGNMDVVFPGDLGYAVVLGAGNGSFGRATLLAESAPSYWAVAGDFDHDGRQDFTGAGGIFGHTYLGQGNGLFQAPLDAGVTATSQTVSGDFNGDGNTDLAMISATPRKDGSNYGFKIAVGLGDGTFIQYLTYVLSQSQIGNLVVADFNADGVSDIATFNSATGSLQVMAGDPLRWIGATIYSSFTAPGVLLAVDVDGNGSSDIVLSNYRDYSVFRSTHGNTPLLSALSLTPAFVLGGGSTSAVVQLGGAAPAGGATVTLSASDAALVSIPATVTVPAGESSATFTISTSSVIAAASVTVTAQAGGVSQSAVLGLVPAYRLAGIAINPVSQYGIFNVRGTITLSNPADAAGIVTLSSANPALASVPGTVTVPAGATSVDFTIALSAVAADRTVAITATRGDVSQAASITVLAPRDTVRISKAQLTQKTSELRIEATGSNSTASISVFNAATGALLGTLDNAGGGKYKGSVFLTVSPTASAPSIVLKSTLGGTVAGAVQVK